MSNGIITCKCGHEVADVPEPHEQWQCPVPNCRRMGAFTWEHTPLAGVLTATSQIMMSLSNMGIDFRDKQDFIEKEIIDIIEKQTGVAELLAACKEGFGTVNAYYHGPLDCGDGGKCHSWHLMKAAIAKAEVKDAK